jgi:transposase
MMGRREGKQGQFFYSFDLDKVVPLDHLVRQIDGVLDLGWVHKELAAYYSHTGRPSIDPVLMIRMLIVGYVFAIRSERRLCAEVQVNLAYRWFCKLGFGVLPCAARALPRERRLAPGVRGCGGDVHCRRTGGR